MANQSINVEIGRTGPDWGTSAPERFYAQRIDAPYDIYAFGPTPFMALANLLKKYIKQEAKENG